ncbi:MAG TPA: phage tail protein [Ilumatobacter sp.]|nr:phage tail protein [Ilumatobacter sp.]
MVDFNAQGAYFSFELAGVKIATFTGCSGLSSEVDVIEQPHTSATGRKLVAKQPGAARTYSEVVLKRGYTTDKALNKWFDETVDAGKDVERKTGSIIILNRDGKELARFNLDGAFPSKLSVSDLNAKSGEALVEELTIRHNELIWA